MGLVSIPISPTSPSPRLTKDVKKSAQLTYPYPQILSLDNGTREYDNECLPSIGNYDYPHDPVPPYSAFPFWDDTYIYAGQPQGIYYQYGNGPHTNITTHQEVVDSPDSATNVTFEYYLSHCCGNGDGGNEKYYHYTVFYDSLAPGIFTFRYYQISENGASATVGMQDFGALGTLALPLHNTPCIAGILDALLLLQHLVFPQHTISLCLADLAFSKGANTAIRYSCNQAVIQPGLEVVLNSIIGTAQHSNFTLPG